MPARFCTATCLVPVDITRCTVCPIIPSVAFPRIFSTLVRGGCVGLALQNLLFLGCLDGARSTGSVSVALSVPAISIQGPDPVRRWPLPQAVTGRSIRRLVGFLKNSRTRPPSAGSPRRYPVPVPVAFTASANHAAVPIAVMRLYKRPGSLKKSDVDVANYPSPYLKHPHLVS